MRRCLAISTLALLLALGGTEAEAKVVRFHGPHPIAPGVHQGMCYIPGPHVHAYEPHQPLLYQKAGKAHVFVGDPVEFEPKAPKVAYYGHHPAFWLPPKSGAPAYCYITGPHHHWHGPPRHLRFVHQGGAYWFVAPHPDHYRADHPQVTALHDHYQGVKLERPVVVAAPPEGFVGVLVTPGGFLLVQGPGVVVTSPGVVPILVPPGHWKHGPFKHGPGHGKFKWKGGMGHGRGKFKW
jgi:hypothetical protein